MSENPQLSRLAGRLAGELCLPGSSGYERATTPRNATARQEPAAVAVVAGPEDVAACVRFAADAGLRVTMQATGHGAAGSRGTDTLLVDTHRLSSVEVDAERRVARVGAGVPWRALQEAAAPHGLLGLSGTAPDVGVAGYTFYGGIGWLTRPYGLASASLRAVDFVDGRGDRRRADAENESEALWAFRGGGGVGFATAVELDLFPVEELTAGYALWPAEHAEGVFSAWGEAVTGWGPSLSTTVSVLHLPDTPDAPGGLGGRPVAYLGAATVDPDQARSVEELLDGLPPAAGNTFGPCSAGRLSGIHLDPPAPTPALGEGRWLMAGAGSRAAGILTACGTGPDSPLQEVEMRHVALGNPDGGGVPGALTAPPEDFMLHAVGAVTDDASRAAVEQGHRTLLHAARPVDTGRSVASFQDGRTSAPDALDKAARERLGGIVAAYDPGRVFAVPRPLTRSP